MHRAMVFHIILFFMMLVIKIGTFCMQSWCFNILNRFLGSRRLKRSDVEVAFGLFFSCDF